jgi:hypothetical protein
MSALLHTACDLLLRNDLYLFEAWINERSLTHRLAVYLEEFFPDYHVDCEYNRNIDENGDFICKKLPPTILEKTITTRNNDGVSVFPDIIIHTRWTNNNYIVIEAKKDTDSRKEEGRNEDILKLRAYKNEFWYKHLDTFWNLWLEKNPDISSRLWMMNEN